MDFAASGGEHLAPGLARAVLLNFAQIAGSQIVLLGGLRKLAACVTNIVIRYSQHVRGLTFAVRVVPRASRSEVGGEHNGALRVRISAAPVDGAANRELARILAKSFGLPQNAVEIVSGANSKNKIVRLQGADATRLEQLTVLK